MFLRRFEEQQHGLRCPQNSRPKTHYHPNTQRSMKLLHTQLRKKIQHCNTSPYLLINAAKCYSRICIFCACVILTSFPLQLTDVWRAFCAFLLFLVLILPKEASEYCNVRSRCVCVFFFVSFFMVPSTFSG
jgi:hypothetical protein